MSHQPERKEKDCLNCGALVAGRYCQVCGQENIITRQGFWSLTKHFIYDIFHFDGKFFDTLKLLVFAPGRVPYEYASGKRQHYLDPIRMYLFTSALFFLVFFSVSKMENFFRDESVLSKTERFAAAAGIMAEKDTLDPLVQRRLDILLDSTGTISLEDVPKKGIFDSAYLINWKGRTRLMELSDEFTIDTSKNVSWLDRKVFEKLKERRESAADNQEMMVTLGNEFIHRLPYLLFLSLPFFALLLKLLYYRHKNYYYSDHAVFTLYHYIFSFILFLLVFGFNGLYTWSGWGIFSFFSGLMKWIFAIYLLLGMKRFYKQGWGKTIIKFILVYIMGLFMLVLIFVLFGLISLIF